jgi:hypothetical protein
MKVKVAARASPGRLCAIELVIGKIFVRTEVVAAERVEEALELELL